MACLYCGKEIGPIRLLRDSEFCSPKHRKGYKDRLQKVLVQVGEPETVPTGMAPFRNPVEPRDGNRKHSVSSFDLNSSSHPTRLPQSWTLSIPEAGGTAFARLTLTAFDASRPMAPWLAGAYPYFGETAPADLLALPPAKLGTLVLRAPEGQPLSRPIAGDYRPAGQESRSSEAAGSVLREPGALRLPGFVLPPAECDELRGIAEPEYFGPPPLREKWMSIPAPEPVVSEIQPGFAGALPAAIALHLPGALPAAVSPPQPELSAVEETPSANLSWMPSPAAEAAVSMVHSVFAAELPAMLALRLPQALSAAVPAPQPALYPALLAPAAFEPVNVEARLVAPGSALPTLACVAPDMARLGIAEPRLPEGRQRWIPVPEDEPVTRDACPSAAVTPVAFTSAPLRFAPFAIAPLQEAVQAPVKQARHQEAPSQQTPAAPPMPAGRKAPKLNPVDVVPAAAAHSSGAVPVAPLLQLPKLAAAPPPARPRHAAVHAERHSPILGTPRLSLPELDGVVEPVHSTRIAMPPVAGERSEPNIPFGELFKVEFYCQRGVASPSPKLQWATHGLGLSTPRFAIRPVFDRLEDLERPKEKSKRPAFAEIFTMPDAVALTKRKAARHAITAIAASVTVAMALWLGASAGKFGKGLLTRDASDELASAARVGSGLGQSSGAASASEGTRPTPNAFTSPVAWVKTAASKRAAVQISDSFQDGMEAWGSKAKGWAPGWARHPDGYVHPGQLALFQPSLNFTDYRMEFFGQIENKSMGWVVRGKDTQNYYAMKFNVVEPGLRPVIAMVHYPVIGGKQGHKVEVPLSVMVHNNTPYHVAVDVRGNHYTTSIEGQEVDSWTDDSLASGGVGFFAEAGTRARIYWMKVSKNDDWLGRVCNYLSGGAPPDPGDTAWLERPELPIPAPERPAPAPSAPVVWTAEAGTNWFGRPHRGRVSMKGEIEKWNS